ncbi:MAG: response regulator [Deltaproteobacteria bacterium]|nr:response regulator [Deltaproteobacteria bacterium]
MSNLCSTPGEEGEKTMDKDTSRNERYRILIVDDEDKTRLSLVRLFSERAEVSSVSNADEALGLLEQGGFDAVLTDYRMPGRDGIWLLAQVRSRYPAVKRFLISGLLPKNINQLIEDGSVHRAVDRLSARDQILSLVES